MVDPATGRSRGFGFVQYRHFSEAVRAIAGMNGYQLENKYLKVTFKTPSDKTSSLSGKPGKPKRGRNGRKGRGRPEDHMPYLHGDYCRHGDSPNIFHPNGGNHTDNDNHEVLDRLRTMSMNDSTTKDHMERNLSLNDSTMANCASWLCCESNAQLFTSWLTYKQFSRSWSHSHLRSGVLVSLQSLRVFGGPAWAIKWSAGIGTLQTLSGLPKIRHFCSGYLLFFHVFWAVMADKFVLLCRSCRTVVAESPNLIRIQDQYYTFSTCRVKLREDVHKRWVFKEIKYSDWNSPSNALPIAEGNAMLFGCTCCKTPLGASYTAVPEGFDYLRNALTFDPNKVTRYTLGSLDISIVWRTSTSTSDWIASLTSLLLTSLILSVTLISACTSSSSLVAGCCLPPWHCLTSCSYSNYHIWPHDRNLNKLQSLSWRKKRSS